MDIMSISLSLSMPNSAFVQSLQPSFIENNPLYCPLLPPAAAAAAVTQNELLPSSNSTIIIRLCTIIFIGTISIWANFAASTSFNITIINDVVDFPARNRINLFYISDDKATRVIQNTSSFIQNILCPKNKIGHVTLRFATATTTDFTVKKDGIFNELVINVSLPVIMGDLGKFDYAVKSMVLQGMTRIWMLSGGGYSSAPPWVVDGIVEYVKTAAGYGDIGKELSFDDFWLVDEKNPKTVAQILRHCESISDGFIQRLNDGLRDEWEDPTVENTLKLSTTVDVCDRFFSHPPIKVVPIDKS